MKDQKLPDLKKGEILKIEQAVMTAGKTKPPAPFNEATLLSAMENPVKYMESYDAQKAKTLGETREDWGRFATSGRHYRQTVPQLSDGKKRQGYFHHPPRQGSSSLWYRKI